METRKARVDRYRELLERQGVSELRPKLEDLERSLQLGEPGSCEPSILQDELAEVRTRGERDRRESGLARPDLLVLCVGTSPEPLLLATAYHQPAEVVLLVEERMGEALARLEELWDHCSELVSLPFPGSSRRKVRDQPAHVFRALRSLLEGREDVGESRVVVDVTGGKKSMVAGAFLAAGFLGVESSYVDFRDYEPVLRRPVPGTVRPGRLEHPEHLFRLRDEARLGAAFDQRRFDEVELLARDLTRMARSRAVVEILGEGEAARLEGRYERTARVAGAYALWSRGFYLEACSELEAVGIVPVAPTVSRLASRWPPRDAPPSKIPSMLEPQELIADPGLVLAYLLDVLVWLDGGYIQRRPREAFLRLYGAWEALILYLVEVFVAGDFESVDVQADGSAASLARDKEKEGRKLALDGCRKNSRLARRILTGQKVSRWLSDGTAIVVERKASPAIDPELAERLFRHKIGEWSLGHFYDLRHKAIHWLAPVPLEAALWLRHFFVELLVALIPLAVRHLEEGDLRDDPSGRASLRESTERLLEAARGRIADDCRSLTHAQLLERIQAAAGGA